MNREKWRLFRNIFQFQISLKALMFFLLIFLISLSTLERRVEAEIIVGPQFDISVNPYPYGEEKPYAAYDSVNNRFLVVWEKHVYGVPEIDVYGQLINADGSLYGGQIPISIVSNSQQGNPQVAFDPVHQRFLVVFSGNQTGGWRIYGQLVNSDGSLYGDNFDLPTAQGAWVVPHGISFDSLLNRFLVLSLFNGSLPFNIYGQFVNPDGSLPGPPFPIVDYPDGQVSADLGYDSNYNRFLVAYGHDPSNKIYGRLLNADGTFYSEEFVILDHLGGLGYPIPFDPVNNRFLVLFACYVHDYPAGQLVNADGSLYGGEIIMPFNSNYRNMGSGRGIFDTTINKFLVVAYTGAPGTAAPAFGGQFVNADGTLYGPYFLVVEDIGWGDLVPVSVTFGSAQTGSLVVWTGVDSGMPSSGDVFGNFVNLVNSLPVLDPIGNQTIYEAQTLEFTIYATDLDNDVLSFSASNLPTGATFVDNNNNTATFSWTPTYAQAGVYPNVHFEVTDTIAIDSEDITITVVNVNRPPVLIHPNRK